MSDNEQKIVFSRNLNKYISRCGKSQKEIADSIGVSPQTFNTWTQGIAMPRMGKVQLLADYFSINKSDLIENQRSGATVVQATRIPVLGRVSAGIPINAVTEIIDTEEISEELAKTGDFFALQIRGDSMEPKISNGDVVIVRQQDDAETGDTVIALVNGDDAVCKRLRKYKDGLELVSTNPSYAPLYFDKKTIVNKPVRIIGKVVELRAKF